MKSLRALLLTLACAIAPASAQTITSTSPLANGTVNVFYSVQLTCSNCAPAAVWAISSGALPPNLGIGSGTGLISGTPTTPGTYNFTVAVNNPGNIPTTKPFSITIFAPLSDQTTAFPNGTVGTTYPAHALVATGGQSPYTWSISAGSLPPGLGIGGATVVGTPTTAGDYGFTLRVADSVGNLQDTTFTLNVVVGPLTVTTSSLPAGAVNSNYTSPALTASGGVPGYTWSISAGSFPPGLGLTVNTNGTFIAGVPTSSGTYAFTLRVSDSVGSTATANLSILISSGVAITTTTLPNGIVNTPYTAQLACVACAGYTWSLSSGNLPPVLAISSSGAITGTPTTTGSYDFVVALSTTTKPAGPSIVTQAFNIVINPPLSISAITLPVGTVNKPYTATLTGVGGGPPYVWSFTSTSNDGLTINSSTGIISGTPTAIGQFELGAMITDSGGATATRILTLFVAGPLSVTTTSLPNGTVGTAYPTQTLAVNGGQSPFRWSVTTGTLPPGLTLNPTFGTIAGTPTTAGAYPFTLTVTDTNANTATAPLSITVAAAGITIAPSALPAGSVGTAYSQALTATGGTAPYVWSILAQNGTVSLPGGTLPAGLTLNTSTGVISGKPTTAGTSTFTVVATDSTQLSGQAILSIVVTAAPLTVTTTSLPGATTNSAYSQTLAAAGGTTPYSWAITSGSLPTGLSLAAATGVINGTPTATGTSTFTAQVTDANKTTAQANLSIVVATATPLTITTVTLGEATVGAQYVQNVVATGGKTPYTWAVTTGSLPAGLILSTAGAIQGTPTSAGTSSFTVTVTDAAQATAKQALSIIVVARLTVTAGALPAGTVGAAYNAPLPLTIAGGTTPYSFSLSPTTTNGAATNNDGLTINATTGAISGTPKAAGQFTLTIVVTDSTSPSQAAAQNFSLTVNAAAPPTVTLNGVPASSGFAQQLTATPTLSTAYPSDVSGTTVLTFSPSVTPPAGSVGTIDDLMIRFSNGTRTVNFTIPAGSTTTSGVTVLTGTTAGTITLTTTLTASGASLGAPVTQTIVNNAGVPFISKVTLAQVPGGVTVTVTGFSSTRDVANAQFAFVPGANDSFNNNDVSVALNSVFAAWYANTAQSNPYGTQFTLTVPFTLTTANGSSVPSVIAVSVTVTLSNSKGASNPVTLSQ